MPDRESMMHFNPQVNITRSTSFRMWLVCCCAFLAVIQSSVGDSGRSLAIALAALVSAFLTELLITYSTHGFRKVKDGSAAASALVLALLLPNHISPGYAAMGAAFAIVVVKHSFGGLGSNWMNPALGGWLFIRFSWPVAFANALGDPAWGVQAFEIPVDGSEVDHLVGSFLNRTIFPLFNAALPPGYIDLFALDSPGIIADRAGLSIVFGIAVIAAFRISRSWLSILYLSVFGLMVRMLGDLPVGGTWWNGDVILGFLSGGTLVAAFILVADPSSGAKSAQGNAVLVVIAAVLGMAFR